MATFVLFTRLGPHHAHSLASLRTLEEEVVRRVAEECSSVRWVTSYVVLGNHNYLDLFEAPDISTALKVGLVVGDVAHAETEVWPLVSWSDFARGLPVERRETMATIPENDAWLVDETLAYLRRAGVPFRVASYPAPEGAPPIAHVLRPGEELVSTTVAIVNGTPAIVCASPGDTVDAGRIGRAIGAEVVVGGEGALPPPFQGARPPIPPLGHLVGAAVLVDEILTSRTMIAFGAFSNGVYVEMAYDDFARIEQPRIVSFAAVEDAPIRPREGASPLPFPAAR